MFLESWSGAKNRHFLNRFFSKKTAFYRKKTPGKVTFDFFEIFEPVFQNWQKWTFGCQKWFRDWRYPKWVCLNDSDFELF